MLSGYHRVDVPHPCLSRSPSSPSCSGYIVYLPFLLPDYEFFVLHPGVVLFSDSEHRWVAEEMRKDNS